MPSLPLPLLPRRSRTGLAAAALAWLASTWGSPAQAQSSYAMTTLKPATSAVPLRGYFSTWAIDAADQVLGSTEYFEGYTWLLSALAFRPKYTQYVARWPATTATSVSPVKVLSATNLLAAASPNGQLLVTINQPSLYDVVAKKVVTKLPKDNLQGLAVNNAGLVLTDVPTSYSVPVEGSTVGIGYQAAHAYTWSVAQGLQALPEGGGFESNAWSVNSAGVVAGQVSATDSNVAQAMLWVGGQMQPIGQPADTAAVAVRINDKGQVLLRRAPLTGCVLRGDHRTYCYAMPDTVLLRDNGVEAVVAPADANRWVVNAFLNNAGVVVGRYRTGPVAPTNHLGAERDDTPDDTVGRAFIWQKGVFTDLTTWVAGKGVTLPAGAVFTRALAINDKGSIVAQLRLANGTTSMVRLTAKP